MVVKTQSLTMSSRLVSSIKGGIGARCGISFFFILDLLP